MTARTPTRIKLLHGERRPTRLPKREPIPAEGLPTKPAGITDEASSVWDEIVEHYGATKVLTPVDGPILFAYCEAVARLVTNTSLYARTGPLARSKRAGDGLAKSPLAQLVRDDSMLVLRLGAALGFSPAARAGLQAPDDDGDELDRWLRSG